MIKYLSSTLLIVLIFFISNLSADIGLTLKELNTNISTSQKKQEALFKAAKRNSPEHIKYLSAFLPDRLEQRRVEIENSQDPEYRRLRRKGETYEEYLKRFDKNAEQPLENIDVTDEHGKTALQWAAWNNSDKAIEALLDAGSNIEFEGEYGRRAIHYAAANNKVKAIIALANKGADLNAGAADGRTALHEAAHNNHVKAIRTLTLKKANVHAKDLGGRTALHWAARVGNVKAIKALLEAGADINARDNEGKTALHYAGTYNNSNKATIKTLLEAGADINARDSEGKTALHIAAESYNDKIIAALINSGANVHATDSEGKSALHYLALGCSDKALNEFANRKKANIERTKKNTVQVDTITSKPRTWPKDQARPKDRIKATLINDDYKKPPKIRTLRQNNLKAIKTLLQAGASAYTTDSGGTTAVSYSAVCSSKVRKTLSASYDSNENTFSDDALSD